MNKKVLLISGVLLTLGFITIILFNSMSNDENNIISNINKDEQVISGNMITMMYETEAGSGEYTETVDNTWPETGYIFNESLSGCENGGELEYNSGNNTVNLLSNSSDRCYVYFDKYDGVWIDNISITNVTGSSVTLEVSATSENGSISKYYYSINDSEEYTEASSNIITINDLNKLTEYNISIYCLDSTNAKSNIYELSISTTDESGPIINSVEVSNITTSGFTLSLNISSNEQIKRYYYSIGGEDNYILSYDSTYIFSELDSGVNYNVLIYVVDINRKESEVYSLNVQTEQVTYLSEYIISHYTGIDGENDLYLHDGRGTYGSLEANDNSYRYSGINPNNYVCFGSVESTCPYDNLYRIIGVFNNEVKLIKADLATSSQLGTGGTYRYTSTNTNSYYKGNQAQISYYRRNTSSNNTWRTSVLNSTNLNGTFLNVLGTSWSDLISNNPWKVGGIGYDNAYQTNIKGVYDYEVGPNSNNETYSAKIGLMYISDYGYAASPIYWANTILNYYDLTIKENNWMDLAIIEFTITRNSSDIEQAFPIGFIDGFNTSVTNSGTVRPTFYLNSDVEYSSGAGTYENPIRLKN